MTVAHTEVEIVLYNIQMFSSLAGVRMEFERRHV